MASDVVAWLESTEGQQWRETVITPCPPRGGIAALIPAGDFSAWVDETNEGIHDPAYDPCGRPPMPP